MKRIIYQGARRFSTIADSEHLGIIIIHQSCAGALCRSREHLSRQRTARFGVIDWACVFQNARAADKVA